MFTYEIIWLLSLLIGALVSAASGSNVVLNRKSIPETYQNSTIITSHGGHSVQASIAAAWLLLSDDTDYRKIPDYWHNINFKLVDLLYVGPAGIQADGRFGLYNSTSTGPLAHRLKWVVQTARSQNPGIKIIVSQWYTSTPDVWGYDLSTLNSTQAIDKYVESVKDFVRTWMVVAGGVDGFDIDYEAENVIKTVPIILGQVRKRLDVLSRNTGSRRFYVTVSPVVVAYLSQVIQDIDYVNMQTYGSTLYTLDAQRFVNIGFDPHQLLYGICPEGGCGTKTIKEVKQLYQQYNLTGIHLWRLNSGNFEHELQIQKHIYHFLHPGG